VRRDRGTHSHRLAPFPDPRRSAPLTALLTTGTLTTLGALAATGLLALFGLPALLGAILLIACSPPALRHLPRRRAPAAQAETRSALLDELAHRDPEGFTRWLHSSTSIDSDPTHFLTPAIPKQAAA